MVSTIRPPDTYLVQLTAAVPAATLQQWVHGDPNVKHLELDTNVPVPKKQLSRAAYLPPMPLTTYATDGHLVQLYGTTAWLGYVQQPAMFATNASSIVQPNVSGLGVVIAVIDTGIDSQNPILTPVLVPGYDFIRNVPGYASDLADSQSIDSRNPGAIHGGSLRVVSSSATDPVHFRHSGTIDGCHP